MVWPKDLEITWLRPSQEVSEWPLANFYRMALLTGSFPIVVLLLQTFIRWLRPALKGTPAQTASQPGNFITLLSLLNNVTQAVLSIYLFVGLTTGMYNNWNKQIQTLVCDKEMSIIRDLDYWVWLFFLSKFYEWFDTLILLFRGKQLVPPENSILMLHIWHHTVTASVAWCGWLLPFGVNWAGPITNTFVHMFMYTYYALTDLKLIPSSWGGVIITPLQLIQFIFCVSLAVGGLSMSYSHDCGLYWPAVVYVGSNYLIFLPLFIKLFVDKKKHRQMLKEKAQKDQENKKKK